MTLLLLTLQWLLLLPALGLAVASWRTSRARRSRHRSFLVGAASVALATLLLALAGLASWLGDESGGEPLAAPWFLAPAFALAACAWVAARALASLDGTVHRRRGAVSR